MEQQTRKETTPSIEPLFPDGTPVNVYDEDGRQVLSGFYVHACISHPCFAGDVRPESYAHTVFNVRMTDWHLPDRWAMTAVTPPHTIEATEPAERTCHPVIEDETEVCSNCGEDIDGHGWSYCPNCGAKVVAR